MKRFLLLTILSSVSLLNTTSWAADGDDGNIGFSSSGCIITGQDQCARFEQKKADKKDWGSRLRLALDNDGDGVLDLFDAYPKNNCRYQECSELDVVNSVSCHIEELECQRDRATCELMKINKLDF